MIGPVASLQSLGVTAIGITTLSLAYILWRTELRMHHYISMHAADRRSTYLLFAISLTASAVLMYYFMLEWFSPALQLPLLFDATVLAALTAQVVAGWVRYDAGRRGKVHDFFAFAMAWLMLAALVEAFFTGAMPLLPRVVTGLASGYMFTLIVLLGTWPGVRRYTLPLQASYIGAFFVAVLVATYVR
jgi:hypothetical protein